MTKIGINEGTAFRFFKINAVFPGRVLLPTAGHGDLRRNWRLTEHLQSEQYSRDFVFVTRLFLCVRLCISFTQNLLLNLQKFVLRTFRNGLLSYETTKIE